MLRKLRTAWQNFFPFDAIQTWTYGHKADGMPRLASMVDIPSSGEIPFGRFGMLLWVLVFVALPLAAIAFLVWLVV